MTREETLYPSILQVCEGKDLLRAKFYLYTQPEEHDGVGIDMNLSVGKRDGRFLGRKALSLLF